MKLLIKFSTVLILFIGFASCDKDDDPPIKGNDAIAFEGSFSREFDVQGATQRATYTVAQDKIAYDLAGDFAQTNYDTKKEYYSKDDYRWVGYRESNNTYSVIFFKNISDTEITLYKKEVASLEAGKTEPVPAADNTENHGWNTYIKGLPISGKVENLSAPQTGGQGQPVGGPFTKFSFETGEVTTSDTDWDIAFRGTTIAINGGAVTGTNDEPARNGDGGVHISTGTFDSVTDASGLTFAQDADGAFAIQTGSGNGWYNYAGPPTHVISPIPGKILVVKTHDGKYAKVEILSYYKDANVESESRHFTFNYVYNPNVGATSLQ